jgi:hypothetical protein
MLIEPAALKAGKFVKSFARVLEAVKFQLPSIRMACAGSPDSARRPRPAMKRVFIGNFFFVIFRQGQGAS